MSPGGASRQAPTCSADVRRAVLAATPLFERLAPDDLARVHERCRAQGTFAGSVVHRAGAPAEVLYVVATGLVKLVQHASNGRQVVLDMVAPGEYFGGLPALGDDTHDSEARTLVDSCLLIVTSEDFAWMLRSFPSVALAALELTARRLREARSTVEELGSLSVEARLARVLVRLAAKLGSSVDDRAVRLPPEVRQGDLAAMTGTTPESVSRTFRAFKDRGALDRRGGAIHVVPTVLAAIAEGGKAVSVEP
jgi:CRP/FNR family transcriptional regulator, nitrogen oxide reductase regulator